MYKRSVTLSNIMDSWKGQQVVLMVQGSKMKPFLQQSTFSQTANSGSKFQKFQALNYANKPSYHPNSYQSQPQFVLRDQELKGDRVSLAELGQFYSNKVMNQQLKVNSNKKFGERDNLNENPVLYQSQKGISFGNRNLNEQKKYGNKIKNKIMKQRDNKQQILERDQILRYIEEMTLPFNLNTQKHIKAKQNFERNKQQTLENISQAGSLLEIQGIILEFKTFTQMTVRELDLEKALVKNKSQSSFSFNEEFNFEAQDIAVKELNKIKEKEDSKIEIINFEQFQDDAKSISSIKSQHQNGTSSDSDPKLFKQDNVIQIAQEFKVEEIGAQLKQPLENGEFRPQNGQTEIQNTNSKTLLEVKNSEQKSQNSICRKQDAPIQNSRLAVEFEKLTKTPVKIIRNLQEAQQFDPAVVKFTEYKVKYIETRRITPEIVRIHSPYKAKPKDERIIKPQTEVQFLSPQTISNKV